MKKWFIKCPFCKKKIEEKSTKCKYCWKTLEYMKDRNELSEKEQQYISKKLAWERILTFFFTWIWLIRCKRRWDFFWCLIIVFILWSIWTDWVELICLLITRLIALINFSKKAYEHDKNYFQKYLKEFSQLDNSEKKTYKKNNILHKILDRLVGN